MYTGSPYNGMEVTIIQGLSKSCNGTVIDTRESDGKEWATVRLENKLEGIPVKVEVGYLLERL
jgi:hypothetical protein